MMKKMICFLLLILFCVGCTNTPAPSGGGSGTASGDRSSEASEGGSVETAEVGSSTESAEAEYGLWQVALVSDYGPVTNESHKQDSYKAAKAWCEEQGVELRVYEPENDATDARIKAIDQAAADGAKVLLLPGYPFAGAIVETVEKYPEVYFIAPGVSELDLRDAKGTPDDLSYVCPENLFCIDYREELGGYLAGYAAVAAGYSKLGLLLYLPTPERLQLCYGFMQGADAAAAALGRTEEIELRYHTIGTFSVDEEAVKALLDAWDAAGTELLFMTSLYHPVTEELAAGVDLPLASDDHAYWADETASESLSLQFRENYGVSIRRILTELIVNENWSSYGGTVAKLGLVSEDPAQNEVGLALPLKLGDGFTEEDYAALVAALYRGELTVSEEIEHEPELGITVIHDKLPG